jgi:hypothetical protein
MSEPIADRQSKIKGHQILKANTSLYVSMALAEVAS